MMIQRHSFSIGKARNYSFVKWWARCSLTVKSFIKRYLISEESIADVVL